jgi:hypothetical protein
LKNKINQENDKKKNLNKIAIKRVRTKLDKKIKWNKMLMDEIEKKYQLKKH